MGPFQQPYRIVLFVLKVTRTFDSVKNEMLWCDLSTEVFSSTLAWFHLALIFESVLSFFTAKTTYLLDAFG